jgi:hypothetical protein
MVSKDSLWKLTVATDSKGRVISAAVSGADDEVSCAVEPLDGQFVHELDVPHHLAMVSSSDAILAAIEDAVVTPAGSLQLREFRYEAPETENPDP